MTEFAQATRQPGVEVITDEDAWVDRYHYNIVAAYVNVGDTYTATLLYDTQAGEFLVTSYGDWLEAYEAEKESEVVDEESEEEDATEGSSCECGEGEVCPECCGCEEDEVCSVCCEACDGSGCAECCECEGKGCSLCGWCADCGGRSCGGSRGCGM